VVRSPLEKESGGKKFDGCRKGESKKGGLGEPKNRGLGAVLFTRD